MIGFGEGTPGLAKCNRRMAWNISRAAATVNEQSARPNLNDARHLVAPAVLWINPRERAGRNRT